jgi:prepilin-type N-terminal cleavage/methylation domain-containing protein
MIKKTSLSCRGFSIVEMAVVLTVIGMIAGAALAVTAAKQESDKAKLSQQRIEFILEAVEDFVAKNGFIPCPADPLLDFQNPDFGFSVLDCVSSSECTTILIGGASLCAGTVPVRSLGISHQLMLDGWNRKFTYGMTPALGKNESTYTATPQGDIGIHSETISGTEIGRAAVLVLSHGQNGHGAWRAKGVASLDDVVSASSPTTIDIENANSTTMNEKYVQQLPSADNDDILIFRAKWQLPDYAP